jgi:hypothetical protein
MATELARMAQIFGSTADWAANDITPLLGEICLELQAAGGVWSKVGDGISAYSVLPWYVGQAVKTVGVQRIEGGKTFVDTIQLENSDEPTKNAQLFSIDWPAGTHSVRLDASEIDGVVYFTARGQANENYTLALMNDGNLYWRGRLIADENGVGGSTWGRFDATGAIQGGDDFAVGKIAVGHYEVSFTVAANANQQALTATVEAGLGSLATATVSVIDDVTIHIFTTDGAIAADQAVDFSRHFAVIPQPIT